MRAVKLRRLLKADIWESMGYTLFAYRSERCCYNHRYRETGCDKLLRRASTEVENPTHLLATHALAVLAECVTGVKHGGKQMKPMYTG